MADYQVAARHALARAASEELESTDTEERPIIAVVVCASAAT